MPPGKYHHVGPTMARLCQCHHTCRHLVKGSTAALLPPERLAELEGVIGTLIDAAHGFDNDGLQLDPECGIHGERAISNAECTCTGERFTAAEFVKTLELYIREQHSDTIRTMRNEHNEAANRRLEFATG